MGSNTLVKTGYFLLVGIIVAAVGYALYLMLVPLVVALLLSFVFDPVINYFETRGFKRGRVLITLTLALCAIGGLAAWLVVPALVTETQHIVSNMPHYKELLRDALVKVQELLAQQLPQLDIPDLYELLGTRLGGGGSVDFNSVMANLSSLFSIVSIVVLIPIFTFFLLADGHLIHKFVLGLVPNRYFEMSILLIHKVTTALKLFLRGQMIDAFAVAVMTAIGLSIIGLPYALVIGVVAGLGNLIPYLGPVIGFLPALGVVMLSDGGFTIGAFVALVIVITLVQFLEGTFVYPIAVGKSVNLHPLVVIIGVTVGGQLGGIVGMLVTIPLISVAKVTVEVLHSYLKAYSIL